MNHESGPGTLRSPNIWEHPEVYEIENRAFDRAGLVEAAMAEIAPGPWRHLLDIGCGDGFHLPRWAERAGRVTGVEPHPPLVERARRRLEACAPESRSRVEVAQAPAQDLPVEDGCVDVAHARWAYFFGPGCEPGLAQLDRVMAPGGTAFVIDNGITTSTFGAWFRRSHPDYDPFAVARFWRRRGWTRHPILTSWQTDTRADFEAIVRIEFAPHLAQAILAEHPGSSVDYAVDVWWRRY